VLAFALLAFFLNCTATAIDLTHSFSEQQKATGASVSIVLRQA